MGGGSGYDVSVPVVFVSEQTGLLLLTQDGKDIIINNETVSNEEINYVGFYILILILIFILISIVCTRVCLCYRNHRQNRNNYTQLNNVEINSAAATTATATTTTTATATEWFAATAHAVSQYPIDSDDMCSICLINFKKNTSVRTLVCNHVFHKHCIELWLLKNWRCPNCNWDPRINKK